MSEENIEWTVTIDGGDIEVRRPSPYCAEHPWGFRGEIRADVIAMVTPGKLAELQANMVAELKGQLVDAEAKLDHCTQCKP